MGRLVDAFIGWASRDAVQAAQVVTFEHQDLFTRYHFLRKDEWPDNWWDEHRERFPKRPNALPWWQPFNVFLHSWNPVAGTDEDFHDHPRWSVTILLKGRIIEKTPWGERLLKPGSVVVRSRKAIHAFKVPEGFEGEIWTLFIVGRRKHRQNTFVVTAQ